MVSESQKAANANYKAKQLGSINFPLMPADIEVFEALQVLIEHYGGKAPAVKAAIIAHAKQIQTE